MKRKHKINKWIRKRNDTLDKERTKKAWFNIFKNKGII